jgi:CRISPR system Cascade subunit CasE
MYLTRFRLNTARRGTRKLLSSPQAMHAAVMASFADALPSRQPDGNGAPRALWRIDHNGPAEVHLFVVGPEKPDLTHLVEQAGWPTTSQWETYAYTPFLAKLRAGDRWAFRLTANPVHHIRRMPGEPTKRTAHVTPRHQTAWLLQRQDAAGFMVLEKPEEERRIAEGDELKLMVHGRRAREFAKRDHKQPVTLVTATFDGHLEVSDPERFRRTLTAGLGRAKAYGCGLMTLGPVS